MNRKERSWSEREVEKLKEGLRGRCREKERRGTEKETEKERDGLCPTEV